LEIWGEEILDEWKEGVYPFRMAEGFH